MSSLAEFAKEERCKGCSKTFLATSLLRHLAHKKTCKETYSASEYTCMQQSARAKSNSKYKKSNKDKITKQNSDYYTKNRVALRSKQAIYKAKNRKAFQKQYQDERKNRVLFKKLWPGLLTKVQFVNIEDLEAVTADTKKLQEAVEDLEAQPADDDKVFVDAKFLEKQTDKLLGDFDKNGFPVLDLSDIDFRASKHPQRLREVIKKIQDHVNLGNSIYPPAFMQREVAIRKREIIEYVNYDEKELLKVIETKYTADDDD